MRLADFDRFFVPQVSPEFLVQLARDLGVPRETVPDVTLEGRDLYTSSLPCLLEHSSCTEARPTDQKCLAISAGPGINVGCATVCL
jgi:hypothetical protein